MRGWFAIPRAIFFDRRFVSLPRQSRGVLFALHCLADAHLFPGLLANELLEPLPFGVIYAHAYSDLAYQDAERHWVEDKRLLAHAGYVKIVEVDAREYVFLPHYAEWEDRTRRRVPGERTVDKYAKALSRLNGDLRARVIALCKALKLPLKKVSAEPYSKDLSDLSAPQRLFIKTALKVDEHADQEALALWALRTIVPSEYPHLDLAHEVRNWADWVEMQFDLKRRHRPNKAPKNCRISLRNWLKRATESRHQEKNYTARDYLKGLDGMRITGIDET